MLSKGGSGIRFTNTLPTRSMEKSLQYNFIIGYDIVINVSICHDSSAHENDSWQIDSFKFWAKWIENWNFHHIGVAVATLLVKCPQVSFFFKFMTEHYRLWLTLFSARNTWRHQMEASSALLALFVGNSSVTSEFPSQRPVTRRFQIFFELRPHKWLGKQSRRRRFKTPSRSLWKTYTHTHHLEQKSLGA